MNTPLTRAVPQANQSANLKSGRPETSRAFTHRVATLSAHLHRSLLAALAVIVMSCGSPPALAQWGAILSQQREGTATLYLSKDTAVAYILDGGAIGGLSQPILDGKPILQGLLEKGYRHLVLSCSHPHEDHAGGLKELIRTDPNLEKFESIRFVDSGYPVAESLFTLFGKHHARYDKARATYSSALNRDAFSAFSREGDHVHVTNFPYKPRDGAAPHGHSIVAHITLNADGKVFRVVDFDDANDDLVRQWSAWAQQDIKRRKPDVVIVPHHGSDGNDLSPLLNPLVRPTAYVITANKDNRYMHPGPENTLKLVNAVGRANVHITGAADNIYLSATGLQSIMQTQAFRVMAEEILPRQGSRIEKELNELRSSPQQAVSSSSRQKSIQKLESQLVAVAKLKQTYAEKKQSDSLIAGTGAAPPDGATGTPPQGPKPPPISGPSGGTPLTLPKFGTGERTTLTSEPAKPKPYGTVCELCDKPAIGRCSIRNIYVCDPHRYFTRNGQNMVCPH